MNKIEVQSKVLEFKKYLEMEEKSMATIEKYFRDVKFFIAWMPDEEITKSNVIRFKEYLLETYKPRSVNSMIAALNSFFKYLDRYDLIIKPVKIQQQQFRNQILHITKREYQKMIDHADDEQAKMLIKTLANSGIRASEVRHITVEAVKESEVVIYNKGKGREVYIPKILKRELLTYCRNEGIKQGSIFVNSDGQPLNRVTIWRKIKKAAELSGVSEAKAFPHNFRHLYAVTFYNKNKDVDLLANILGHSSINTTRIYIQEDKQSCIRKIERAFSGSNII